MNPDTNAESSDESTSRRHLIKSGLFAGVVGILGFGAGSASAQSEPSGEVGTQANPWSRIYATMVAFVARDSDPSSPADGTLWYNEDP